MKKIVDVNEMKKVVNNDAVFETENGFIVNMFGKYQPNIVFVLRKTVELDGNGNPVNPVEGVDIPAVTAGTNIDFDGDVKVLFGTFWRSRKGSACFRPELLGKDMLLEISWGGCFNRTRGLKEAPSGVLYFRRASSNGGGAGADFVILPAGYQRRLDEEGNELDPVVDTHADYLGKAMKQLKDAAEKADADLKAKITKEKMSAATREKYLPKLQEIKAELEELRKPKKFGWYGTPELKFGEASFKMDCEKFLYDDESLETVEKKIDFIRSWIASEEARKEAAAH